MQYYKVKITFEIPVAIKDGEDKVDAYYAARKEFSDFNINEADSVKIEPMKEEEFNKLRTTINVLHDSHRTNRSR